MTLKEKEMKSYSCKLLFQWNPYRDGKEYRKRRVCEERIYTYVASTSDEALAKAQKIGEEGCFDHQIEDGQVYFQFVGIIDLIELIDNDEDSEVWYEIVERRVKDGELDHLIPQKEELALFKTKYKKKLIPW